MTGPSRPSAWRYIACYVLYAVLLLLCVVDFAVWQRATSVALELAMGQSQALSVVHGGAVVIGAFILFGVAMAAEPYLRSGVHKRELRARFGRLLVGLVAVCALCLVVLFAAYRAI